MGHRQREGKGDIMPPGGRFFFGAELSEKLIGKMFLYCLICRIIFIVH